jgi:Ca2+-binding EF-hand superfamily protein
MRVCREAFSCYAEPHLPPGQGAITTRELGQLMRALGKNPTQDELVKLFQKVDPQQEGSVKFETFCTCMMEPMKQPGECVRTWACVQTSERGREPSASV